MAATQTGHDALVIARTGASGHLSEQPDPRGSLGGYAAVSRMTQHTPYRATPIANVRFDYVSGTNPLGNGLLQAVTADTLRWQSPGDVFGPEVVLANGETRMLPSDDPSLYAIVTRLDAADLVGQETVQILETYYTTLGFPWLDVEQDGGAARYAALALRNAGTAQMTNVKVWNDSTLESVYAIAKEDFVADEIQLIPNAATAPTGVSFSTPTTLGTALNCGTLDPGEQIGLWCGQAIAALAPATARLRAALFIQWTAGGEDYLVKIGGTGTIEDLSLALYLLYIESIIPDPATDTPVATSSDGSFSYAWSPSEGTYYRAVYKRSAYGLLSPASPVLTYRINGDGENDPTPPRGPDAVQLLPVGEGALRVDMTYYANLENDAALAATHFVVWVKEGSAPDMDTDPATATIAMGATARLGRQYRSYTTDEFIDDAPVYVGVRTHRVDDDGTTVSENTGTTNARVFLLGPGRPPGRQYLGDRALFVAPAEGVTETVHIDVDNNIYWAVSPDSLSLYADTSLIFRVLWRSGAAAGQTLYVPSDWLVDTSSGAVSGAATEAAIEVASWDSQKTLYVTVNGARRMEIDVTAKTLLCDVVDTTAAVPAVAAETPAWRRYEDTLLQVFDVGGERGQSFAQLDDTSAFNLAVSVNNTLAQAAIEAL